MQRILLVEDDSSIVRSLTAFLAEEGFSAASAPGERRARELLCEESFDLLLVDISLADGSGFGVCAAAKERGLPVIFLTAFGDEGSVVTGLDMGADDYIAKPFRPRELVSRIRSVLRRCGKSQAVVTLGNVTVDTEKGVATKGGNDLYLSALEYRLLLVFVNNRGKVFSREALLETVWKYDYTGDARTVDVHIRRLREKIERNPAQPEFIFTKWGVGYYFTDKD